MKNTICKQQTLKHEASYIIAMPQVCSWFNANTDRPGAKPKTWFKFTFRVVRRESGENLTLFLFVLIFDNSGIDKHFVAKATVMKQMRHLQ